MKNFKEVVMGKVFLLAACVSVVMVMMICGFLFVKGLPTMMEIGVKDFLLGNDLRYIIKSVHEKTNKKYWLFEGTEQLNQLLTEWRLRKH